MMDHKSPADLFLEMGKIPPQVLDVEEKILGALMTNKNLILEAYSMLSPEMFYNDAHKRVYTAIHELFEANKEVDVVTVTQQLKSKNELESTGGPYFLATLASGAGYDIDINTYVGYMDNAFKKRELIRVAYQTLKQAYDDTTDAEALLKTVLYELYNLSIDRSVGEPSSAKEIVDKAVEIFKKNYFDKVDTYGLQTNTCLDTYTHGLIPSDLIVLAGRPGMGKTSFMLALAQNIALHNIPVAIFSLEMKKAQLIYRLACIQSQISYIRMRRPHTLDTSEYESVQAALDKIGELPVYIADDIYNILTIRSYARSLKYHHNIQAVFLDYVGLIQHTDPNIHNREQTVAQISLNCKAMAKELDVPVILLSQLNRDVERKSTKRPSLAELRESGALEQDADIVLMLYRPEYYGVKTFEDGSTTEGIVEVIIAKHRNGPTGSLQMRFTSKYMQFTDLEETHIIETTNQEPF